MDKELLKFWQEQRASLLNEAHWLDLQMKAIQNQRASVLQQVASIEQFTGMKSSVSTIEFVQTATYTIQKT